MEQDTPDFWVFAYGSLIWQPDFAHLEVRPARLGGYHRAMCILSTIYRGTPERPGLVLGLDRGGSCRGRAFRVAAAEAEAVRAMLHEREMVTRVYLPRMVAVRLDDGGRVPALAFIADRSHAQYFPAGDPARAAALIRQGVGKAGASRDYLSRTVASLAEMGVTDRGLRRLLELVEGERPPPAAASS
ncbi:MAG: gamma-glutamylcyclotransferase [Phaeospirillum sp.]|nr:gamma-glutamylcyclotransferase [Phaeospirillum sp.]